MNELTLANNNNNIYPISCNSIPCIPNKENRLVVSLEGAGLSKVSPTLMSKLVTNVIAKDVYTMHLDNRSPINSAI
jgi:hypothetical protein